MLQPLDGPAVSTKKTISSSEEVKVESVTYDYRKTISVQPLNGDIYLSYTSPATSSNAFLRVYKRQFMELERGHKLPVYMVPVSGTVDVLVGEVS